MADRTAVVERGNAMFKAPRVVLGTTALLLAVTACGGGDDDSASGTTAAPAGQAAAATAAPVATQAPAATAAPAATDAPAATAAPVATAAPASEEESAVQQTLAWSPGTAPAAGDPIKVGFINLEGGAVSLPELRIGAETAAAYVTAHGGINGRPLEIVPCNVDGTPEKSIDCANRLVGDGVSVVMEGYDPSSDAILPVLDSAGLPLTGHAAFGPQQQVADNAFFFGTANPTFTAGFLDHYAKNGVDSMMLFLPDNAAFRASVDNEVDPIADELGLDVNTTFYNPASPDWAALATSALAENPDVVATVAPDGDCLGLLSALRSVNFPNEIFLGACSLFMIADPAGAVGVSTTSDLWKPTDIDTPPQNKRDELQLYIDVMTAAGHADVINGFAWNYFSDTWNLAAVLASIQGDVTPESITDAFRATKDLDSFMGPSITCDHTAWPGESACGNRVLLYKVEEGGSQKAITPDFIDTSPYIAVLGG
jgi:branched-chain amino acid transport system substrate-binding protein